jgi:acetyl-CoA carboxylase carboxyl transferase subunit beta
MRETLSRICRLLMAGADLGKAAGRTRRANGPHVNGAPVDGKLIESAARQGSGGVIDAEPVTAGERFEPTRTEVRDKVKDATRKDNPRA